MTKTERKQFISELLNLGRHIEEEDTYMENIVTERVDTYSECKRDGYSLKYQLFDSEIDTEEKEDVPVYVYDGSSIAGLTFKEFSTIADAVRFAIKSSDSKVLLNGEIVDFVKCSDNTAYYIDDRAGKLKIVAL